MELIWTTDKLFDVFNEGLVSRIRLDDRGVTRCLQGGSGEWS